MFAVPFTLLLLSIAVNSKITQRPKRSHVASVNAYARAFSKSSGVSTPSTGS
jgi:hypothetical protein